MDVAHLGVLTCLHESAFDELYADLARAGIQAFVLDGASIVDEAMFLAGVERDLPTTPGLRAHGWDAMVDVLSYGLSSQPADAIAVVWRHADRLEREDVQVFLDAVAALTSVASRLFQGTNGRSQRGHIILVGSAPNYPRSPAP